MQESNPHTNRFEERFDTDGEAVIQHSIVDRWQTRSGQVIQEARLGYCVFGSDPSAPLVILHPSLTGTVRARSRTTGSQGDGWWSDCVGPGRFLDTERLTVVCVDHLGGNGASTGAGELPADLTLSFQDTVSLVAPVLVQRGINHLHAVVGGSVGAGQTMAWLFQDEVKVERLFEISGNAFHDPQTGEFFRLQADLLSGQGGNLPEIETRLRDNLKDLTGRTMAFDAVFQHVLDALEPLSRRFTDEGALHLARQIGMLRFVTPLFFQKIWDRWLDEGGDQVGARGETCRWLDDQGDEILGRFTAQGLASLCRMEALQEPVDAELVARRIADTGCQLVGFSSSGDVLFDANRQFTYYQSVRDALDEDRRDLVDIYFAYDEINGHDHFLSPEFLNAVPSLSRHLYDAPIEDFATRAIHEGLSFKENTGAIIPPVYLTSTFASGNKGGFDYTRSGNPNFRNLEQTIASLENAAHATVYGSGVAAITAVISTLMTGDLVIAEEVIYGCTYRLFEQVFLKFGLQIEYLDFTRPESLQQVLEKKPALVWIESPTNPLLKIIDIKEVSKYTARAGSTLLVDNTFASSFFQRPLDLGADLSLSSTTKYINGHSDCLGGVVCTNHIGWREKLIFAQKALGLNPAPFDTWLITRGVKTLSLRMERHADNAMEIARHLQELPEVEKVFYPMLPDHQGYDVARRQMQGGSGIVAARFKLDDTGVVAFLSRLQRFTLAESLGGIESLVCHPATMTHASVPKEQREKLGITNSLVRFSVGVEHVDDLINDIDQALAGST
jgi:cystathionine gamma-synthase